MNQVDKVWQSFSHWSFFRIKGWGQRGAPTSFSTSTNVGISLQNLLTLVLTLLPHWSDISRPGINKIVTKFIKTIFKDSKKVKELEIMYQNAIYTVFLDKVKFADFLSKNYDVSRTEGMCHLIHMFFGSSLGNV